MTIDDDDDDDNYVNDYVMIMMTMTIDDKASMEDDKISLGLPNQGHTWLVDSWK